MSETTLPIGWIPALLGEFLFLKNGYAFKSTSYVEQSDYSYPVIRISDIDGVAASDNKATHVNKEDIIDGFEINRGDLLIAMSGATTGKVGVYQGNTPAYQNQRVGNLKLHSPRNGSDPYKNHLIASLRPQILEQAYGGAQPNISAKAIEELPIILPPLAEQQQIAALLDQHLAQVDLIKRRVDAIPKTLKRFRQSVLATAVSGKLTEEFRKSKQLNKWTSKTVNDVCQTAFDGPFGSKLKTADYTDNGVRVARLENIGHLVFVENKRTYISKGKHQELIRNSIEPGDILFSSFVDEEVRVCLFPKGLGPFINKADCFCLRPNPQIIDSTFLTTVLASRQTYQQVKEQVHGATRPRINLKFLKSFEIGYPELEEQTEIVRRVDELFTFADQIEQRVKDAQSRIDKLTQSILAKAFRGELTLEWRTANPDLISDGSLGNNSAEALLERIKAEREAMSKKKATKKKPVKRARKKQANV